MEIQLKIKSLLNLFTVFHFCGQIKRKICSIFRNRGRREDAASPLIGLNDSRKHIMAKLDPTQERGWTEVLQIIFTLKISLV